MSRLWVFILVAASLIALGCKAAEGTGEVLPNGPPPESVEGFPTSIVALGDSISAAFGSCLAPTACPRNSWSSGDGNQVNSHYRRILRDNPGIANRHSNLAVPGITVSELKSQAEQAIGRPADYITILIGANDACRGDMTAPDVFRSQLDAALGVLRQGLPNSQVLLVGLPNVYRVWEIGHTNRLAQGVWKHGVCPNLLANATSTEPADVNRRNAFRDRIAAYNVQLRAACASYGPKCRYDDVSSFAFELTMLSSIDFFHPNAAGQNALADQTYPADFNW